MTLPKRPISKPLQTKVIRLRSAIKESRQIKKDYASARGKHFLNFLRESAQDDLDTVEVAAFEASRLDLTECADQVEAANSEVSK